MPLEMNMFWAVVLLVGGLLILIKGADLLVDGAVGLARRFGVSPLIIGLTVVAMGTSAPEVAASIAAALRNSGDMAVGNVYGSNIANLALVGGICAIIRPIEVKVSVIKRELPVMLAMGLLILPLLASHQRGSSSTNPYLARGESLVLLVVFVILIFVTVI